MTSRSEIRKFADTHFGGTKVLAKELGISESAVRLWDKKPELMLKYLLDITGVTDWTVMDVVEAVKAQKKHNSA